MNLKTTSKKELEAELVEVRRQLYEANETIEAIRTGQVDALIVHDGNEHQLYTLRTADQGYRTFIEKMNEGAVTLNEQGIILYCNSTFAKMVREPIFQVTGREFSEFVSDATCGKFKRLLEQGLKGVSKGEVDLKTAMLPLPVQVSFTALKMEEIVSVSVIITDLSEQKKTQIELQQKNYLLAESNKALEISNHDLQQFASVASHDLQEPLRKIHIFSNLLQEKDGDALSPEAKKYISKIISSTERMKTLVIDLLNYSKLSSADEPFDPISLNEVILEVLDDLEMIIQEKNAEINVDLLPHVIANRGQMRQVFQNLLYNALKFSREGISPKILIQNEPGETVQKDDGKKYCCFSVRDNGIGFNQKHSDNIFSLFKRLHSKDAFEGSGIGLAITRKIIEKHHGTIVAKSEEGSGAAFFITLPKKLLVLMNQKAKTILLAEDDADDRIFFREFIEDRNDIKLLEEVENGEELLKVLHDDRDNELPDLIILDQNMPKLNGFQTLEVLENDARYADIPVMVYSTYINDHLIQKCKEAGAVLVATKPINKRGYINLIDDFLHAIR